MSVTSSGRTRSLSCYVFVRRMSAADTVGAARSPTLSQSGAGGEVGFSSYRRGEDDDPRLAVYVASLDDREREGRQRRKRPRLCQADLRRRPPRLAPLRPLDCSEPGLLQSLFGVFPDTMARNNDGYPASCVVVTGQFSGSHLINASRFCVRSARRRPSGSDKFRLAPARLFSCMCFLSLASDGVAGPGRMSASRSGRNLR